MNDRIDHFDKTAQILFRTAELQRILEETELSNRQVFFGAAGTDKTLVVMERARRPAVPSFVHSPFS